MSKIGKGKVLETFYRDFKADKLFITKYVPLLTFLFSAGFLLYTSNYLVIVIIRKMVSSFMF